ncbi:MAG TPA: methylmalonyl-CoA mutase subunit beta [Pseudolabrys sp.]|uniref:methylmalonyl-CoA mutase subunit beta n=1 Tax=Pseudolabrys sp. TaxID=1960880 RepID=UPI002DDCC621|nr:methylmalonyl-CoA mutase subunit beta [Pseudolabrys sp.]HEV2629344.1 methylmalonyl-CoA mutase subunit beta [Pseudolabrys sp.]
MSDPAVHQDLPLAAEFPATDRAEWRRLVEKALKDRPFEKLVSRTYDGIAVEPLYGRAAGVAPVAGRAPGLPWRIMQRVDHPDPAAANAEALQDLANGADALALVLAGAPSAHGFGVKADNTAALAGALDGVMLDLIALRVETAPFAGRPIAELVTGLVAARKLDPARLTIDFGLDPLGDMARTGRAPLPWPDLSQRAGETAKGLADKGYAKARFLRADGRAVHEAGGSEAQELAFVVATGIAYLRLLEVAGFALDDARKRMTFMLAADADEFLTVAKFRAVRKLWARVEEACGLTPHPAYVAAETAWRMMSAPDPYVNMLRTTIAVTAAGVGGADSITVLPFTAALGLPDRFARRVARNQQLILLEESNLYRVADPAAGSGGIEALTSELTKAAWALVQDIERTGGVAAALEQGLIQKTVATTRAARQAAVAKRRDALTGVSDYPGLSERPVKVLNIARVAPAQQATQFEPLPSLRLAEPFERLRDRSDTILKKTGARPKVFLANLGKASDFTARATFAKNFYEAGGIETVGNDGFKNRDDMIAAFKASGARLACLCSSDKVYAADAADAATALTEAGAVVHLAGRPGEHEAAWNAAGVKAYIYVGCDVLATLTAAHAIVSKP